MDSNLSSAELIDVGDIPEWMLWEVLMRLPLNVLFQSKTVSKRWCSMISGPSFARMYADRIWRFPLWNLVSSFANKAMIDHFSRKKLALDGCNSIGANCLDLLILRHGQEIGVGGWDFIVVAISNGLLLYGPRVECASRLLIYSYDICNPITGQRITLPPSQHCFEFVATGFVTQVQDNVLHSFRVVRVDVHHMDSGFIRFDVYFSEIRKWKYFKLCTLIYFYKWKNPVVLRQTLHWMITQHRLVAYDPYNKPDSVRVIRLPSDDPASYETSKIDVNDVLFDEHQGHLRYAEVIPDCGWTNVSIWVLEDYDRERWCLQHRVSLDELSYSSVSLSFHPFDSNIVYMINNKLGLYSYDFKSRELIVDGSRRCYRHQLPYALSYFNFVIRPWPLLIHPSLFEVTD